MGTAKREDLRPEPPSMRAEEGTLPLALRKVLPAATARAWRELQPILPPELYLIGGTAVAVHLGHRESRDLDFLFHESSVDLAALRAQIESRGEFAVTDESPGTLCGLYGPTKVEFFHADEGAPQHLLEEPAVMAGLRVASLKDLMAMKLKVVRDRAEMRDYFDLKAIDEQGGVSVEEGLRLFLVRYEAKATGEEIRQVIRSLGYLDDVDEDKTLPITKDALAKWWASRQVTVVRHLDRYFL
jgi:hypothetical protein